MYKVLAISILIVMVAACQTKAEKNGEKVSKNGKKVEKTDDTNKISPKNDKKLDQKVENNLKKSIQFTGWPLDEKFTLGKIQDKPFTVKDVAYKYPAQFIKHRVEQLKSEKEFASIVINQYGLERLLNHKAKEMGLKGHQALLDKITSKVKDPTEDEIKQFFEKYKKQFATQKITKVEDAKETIIGYLTDQQKHKVALDFVENLKKESNFKITIPTPDYPSLPINIADTPFIGKKDAPVKLVMFSEFQCPYCSKAAPLVHSLHKKFPEKLAIYFKHFPLDFHKHAKTGAIYSHCLYKQGKFWEYHDKVFENQRAINGDNLIKWAKELNPDMDKFNSCISSAEAKAKVEKDFKDGEQIDVNGTPTIFVNGKPVTSLNPVAIEEVINNELSGGNKGKLKDSTTVLTFLDQKITWGEIIKHHPNKLAVNVIEKQKLEYKFLNQVSSQYLSEKLLEIESKEKKFNSIQEYMKEILKDAKEPTEEQLKGLYQSLKNRMNGASFEQVKTHLYSYQKQLNQKVVAEKEMKRLYDKYKALIKIPKPVAPKLNINTEGSPFMGPKDGKIEMVIFSEFQCPYCGKYAPFFHEVHKKYPNIKIVFKHFPLSFHKEAMGAAIASACAHQQGKFWEYHDKLFENQTKLSKDNYTKWAEELKLDGEKFKTCLSSKEIQDSVRKDLNLAQDIGVQGTPTVFINGVIYKAGYDMKSFDFALKSEFSK